MIKAFFVLLVLNQTPQDSTHFKTPHEIFNICHQLESQGEFEKAANLYKSISPNDTSYLEAQTYLMGVYNSLELYDSTIAIGGRNKDVMSNFRKSIYVTLGNAYMRKGDYNSGLDTYLEGLQLFPFNYILLYNTGYAYYRKNNYPESVIYLQKSLKVNPFYGSSHVLLGYISMLQGQTSKALLCYLSYLAINPTDNNILVFTENLANDAIRNEGSIEPFIDNRLFQHYDDLIKSKAALDERFKIGLDFDSKIVRQTELLFSKLEPNPQSSDFWMQLYVPVYTAIEQQDLTPDFIYFILQSTKKEDVISYIEKNDKKKNQWVQLIREAFLNFRSKNDVEILGAKNEYSFWYYNNNTLNAIGNEVDSDTKVGPWEFFADNGQLTDIGRYNQEGAKIGEWNYFFEDGKKSREEFYNNEGNALKPAVYYFNNGSKRIVANYKDDKLDGFLEYYYDCGQLKEQVPFKEGKKEGDGKVYFQTGELKIAYTFKDEQLDGDYYYYFKNGQVSSHLKYMIGVKEGPFASFYENGSKNEIGQYKADSLDGEWIGFFMNGKVSYEGVFINGKRTGEWLFYYPNGIIKESTKYYNNQDDKEQKDSKYYTITGKLRSTETYIDDMLVSYAFYSENGEELSNAKNENGNMEYNSFYNTGEPNLITSVEKGNLRGAFKRYYKNGNIAEEGTMKEGYYVGPYKSYFQTGQLQVECTYKKGELNGYYTLYYKNGNIHSQGWYINDQPEQTWTSYNPDGTLNEVDYYIDGKINGSSNVYGPNNKIAAKYIYEDKRAISVVQYDSLGNKYHEISTPYGNGTHALLNVKGDTLLKTTTTCGENVSDLVYINGKKIDVKYTVKNGAYNGPFLNYDSDGTLITKGDYMDGDKSGKWKWYHFNGNTESEYHYEKGDLDGIWKDYYYSGTLESTTDYLQGNVNGTRKYYDQSGNLQLIKIYQDDELISYINVAKGDTIRFIEKGDFTLKSYFDNGKLAVEQNFSDGVFNGALRYYNIDGTQIKYGEYKNGDKEGRYINYYPNGKIYIQKMYKDDLLNGPFKQYYENGKIRKEAFYLNDKLYGKEVIYNPDGSVKSERYYWGGYEY